MIFLALSHRTFILHCATALLYAITYNQLEVKEPPGFLHFLFYSFVLCFMCIMCWIMVWQCSITYIRIKEMKNWESEIRFRYSIWPCPPTLAPKCLSEKATMQNCQSKTHVKLNPIGHVGVVVIWNFRLTWWYFAVNGIQEKALAKAQSRLLGTGRGARSRPPG